MEIQDFTQIVTGLDIKQCAFIVVAMWWFTKDIKREVHEIKEEMRSINVRVGRLEGTVYGRNFYKEAESDGKD